MSTRISLPAGSYVLPDPRASCKRLVGCFSEPEDQDAPSDDKDGPPPVTLRRMEGLTTITGDGSVNAVRGMWEMAGTEYAVIGTNLYAVTPNNAVLIGTGISGSSFVRMTDNGACLVILVPNSSLCWTYAPNGGGFQQLTTTFFTALGAKDCWFVDTFIVFLAVNGTTFFNDDGRAVSGNNQITFTTAASFSRAFGTDLFVGGAIDHREIVIFGSRTTEGYINVGNAVGTPFSSAPDTFMEIGAHPLAPYAIAKQDQSIFWIANDRSIRRRSGQTPTRVSNAGIEQILKKSSTSIEPLTGCYALTPTIGGHPMWVLTMPAISRTVVYDCLTQKWFELSSFGLGYWRPLCYHNGLGLQLLGDSQSGNIGFLDPGVFTEFGQVLDCEFTTQPIFSNHDRITHRRIELVATMGEGSSQTVAPIVDLLSSDDSGVTFQSFVDPQTLGTQGEYDHRAVWFNLGQSRDRVYRFRITDPTPLFTVGVFATLEGGKW